MQETSHLDEYTYATCSQLNGACVHLNTVHKTKNTEFLYVPGMDSIGALQHSRFPRCTTNNAHNCNAFLPKILSQSLLINSHMLKYDVSGNSLLISYINTLNNREIWFL